MRKRSLLKVILCIGVPLFFLGSCVDDKHLLITPPVPDQSFVEEFDTVTAAFSRGWTITNTSVPRISNIWQQGGDVTPFFPAFSSSGSYVGFIGVSAVTSQTLGIVSEWLISPAITLQNGDKIVFYTRGLEYDDGAGDLSDFGNRLQLRLNTNNDGVNVGQGSEVGDFTTPLLDINPTYILSSAQSPVANSYPITWTRFEATVYGLQKPVAGRFAFKFFIEDGATNGGSIGIDKVTYKSAGY